MTATVAPTQQSAVQAGESTGRKIKNHAATTLVWLAFLVALIPLVWIMWMVLSKGLGPILHANWWLKDQSGVGAPGFDHNVRGARHAIIGTLEMALATSVIAIPIAIMTAVYLVEYGRGLQARIVSFMVDILSGVPSIVAALFILAAWVGVFGLRLMPVCASLALVLLMIPVVTRSTEEMLKLVPNELREASYALGVPKWKTIVRIVLPTSMSGIITGSLLGFARVAGETAPLLILASYTQFLNYNLGNGDLGMAALPTLINQNVANMAGDPTSADRVWGAACTLILIVLAINLLGRLLGRLTSVKK
ncbi:phosphate ABC transporter permease PstA [Calidifontibacter terrae]